MRHHILIAAAFGALSLGGCGNQSEKDSDQIISEIRHHMRCGVYLKSMPSLIEFAQSNIGDIAQKARSINDESSSLIEMHASASRSIIDENIETELYVDIQKALIEELGSATNEVNVIGNLSDESRSKESMNILNIIIDSCQS